MTSLLPLGTKIVILPDPAPETTEGGLHVISQAPVVPYGYGTVVAAGDEVKLVVEGIRVVFHHTTGIEVEHEGTTYRILQEGDLIAALSDETPKGDQG